MSKGGDVGAVVVDVVVDLRVRVDILSYAECRFLQRDTGVGQRVSLDESADGDPVRDAPLGHVDHPLLTFFEPFALCHGESSFMS